MYARSVTVRGRPRAVSPYSTEVSQEIINSVIDAVMAEVTARQRRQLEPVYPAVFFDACG